MVTAAVNPVQYFEQVWRCCHIHEMILTLVLTFDISLATKLQQLIDQRCDMRLAYEEWMQ